MGQCVLVIPARSIIQKFPVPLYPAKRTLFARSLVRASPPPSVQTKRTASSFGSKLHYYNMTYSYTLSLFILLFLSEACIQP